METKTTYLASLLQTCIDSKAHLAGKLIHAHMFRSRPSADTFLSNRLIEFYAKCNAIDASRRLFDQMPKRDIYTWNAILGAYCKASKLEDARVLFAEMPERNIVSWNTLICALARNGFEENALSVYHGMRWEGFMPTHFTLASVLSVCGALADVECGRRCHGTSIKIGLDSNMYVGNALLGMYAKGRYIGDAIQAFGDVPKPNEVSFTALMGALANSDQVDEAFSLFRMMLRNRIHVDSVSLSTVLGVCSRGGCCEFGLHDSTDLSSKVHGQQVHCLTIKLGFETDIHVSNSLLGMYTKNGNMNSAEMIFVNMPQLSNVSWNVMIAGYGLKYQSNKAIEYLQRMQYHGFKPDEVTFVNMLVACIRSGDYDFGRQMFDGMLCPSLMSWNTMLSGYAQTENHKEVVKLFREMQFRSVHPDRTTLAIILRSLAGMMILEGGRQVHAVSQKASFHADVYLSSGLIGMYSKCGKIETAKRIFCRMAELDIVCWNSMMAGLSLNSLDREAFTYFKQMRGKGMFPSQFSYATVLSCCAKLSCLSQGRQVHSQMVREGYMNDAFVGSALIDMYSKCGDVDAARCLFDMMIGKNTVTWNEMIHGYAQNGRGDEAVVLYEDMIGSGEKPDGITFVAVLTACSHSGLVDTGIRIFNSMKQEHGIEPTLEHYTCIIDTLGRAGRLHEAEVLIDTMSCKDDPIIWEVLLSSCRVHADVNLARRAAEELLCLDPQNSAPYVLLANIYSSLGRWDDAKAVRKLMNNKQVVKNPGYSWVEHKNGMLAFMVDDNSMMVNDDTVVVNN